MDNFFSIEYLAKGSIRQRLVYSLLKEHRIFENLKKFTPTLVGTIPIGVDTERSDLDIICHWDDGKFFEDVIRDNFSQFSDFLLYNTQKNGLDTIISRFVLDGFQLEIFGQNRPVCQQDAYLHMVAEHVILQEQGEEFRLRVIELKMNGVKTEPAFAQLMGFKGNGYKELLEYGIRNIKTKEYSNLKP